MRSRLIAVFVVGVLVGAVLLGGGVFALQSFGSEAEAQGGATWQLQVIEPKRIADTVVIEDIEDWVTALPAECDLVPSVQGDLFFYRCPAP